MFFTGYKTAKKGGTGRYMSVDNGFIAFDSQSIVGKRESASQVRIYPPIERIQRHMVEEDLPRRNFGDYDPVRNVLPKFAERRRPALPIKLDVRRVMYKGISRTGSSQGKRTQAEACVGNKRSDSNVTLSEDYRRLQTQNLVAHLGSSSGPDQSGLYANRKAFDNLWYNKLERQLPKSNDGCVIVNCSRASESDSTRGDNNYQRPGYFTYSDISYTKSAAETRKFFSYNYDNKFQSEPILDYGETDNSSMDMNSTQKNHESAPQSSWMAVTKGTGFYQSQNVDKAQSSYPQNEPTKTGYCYETLPTESAEYGYSTGTKEPDQERCGLEYARNEWLFSEKVEKFNYTYRITRLPKQEKFGSVYYGFELEFWPSNDQTSKKIVWGKPSTEVLAAKESTFAEGLRELTSLSTQNCSKAHQNYWERFTNMQLSVNELNHVVHTDGRIILTMADMDNSGTQRQDEEDIDLKSRSEKSIPLENRDAYLHRQVTYNSDDYGTCSERPSRPRMEVQKDSDRRDVDSEVIRRQRQNPSVFEADRRNEYIIRENTSSSYRSVHPVNSDRVNLPKEGKDDFLNLPSRTKPGNDEEPFRIAIPRGPSIILGLRSTRRYRNK